MDIGCILSLIVLLRSLCQSHVCANTEKGVFVVFCVDFTHSLPLPPLSLFCLCKIIGLYRIRTHFFPNKSLAIASNDLIHTSLTCLHLSLTFEICHGPIQFIVSLITTNYINGQLSRCIIIEWNSYELLQMLTESRPSGRGRRRSRSESGKGYISKGIKLLWAIGLMSILGKQSAAICIV